MSTVSLVTLDLAAISCLAVAAMHLLNRKLRPHCVAELERYIQLAEQLKLCHAPRSNAYALVDEFAATCADLAAHHRSYSLAAYCFQRWYSRCRSLERRCQALFDAYVGLAGNPASVLKRFNDEED